MKIINKWILLLLTLFASACNPAGDEGHPLQESINKEIQRIKFLRTNIKNLSSELSRSWIRSLKYRFPRISPIVPQEISIKLQETPYIKSICFQYKSNHKLELTIRYYTRDKKVSPNFVLYFFSDDGANIHRQDITYKGWILKKYLARGRIITKVLKINILDERIPQFFLIRKKI